MWFSLALISGLASAIDRILSSVVVTIGVILVRAFGWCKWLARLDEFRTFDLSTYLRSTVCPRLYQTISPTS